MSRTDVKPCGPLYAVCDPDGNLVHTCLSTIPKEAQDEFCKIENTISSIFKPHQFACSWEQFEAEGYTIHPVMLIPHPTLQADHVCQSP